MPLDLIIDGRSFLPLLQGREFKSRDSIYMWHSRNGVVNQARAFARNQTWMLYDSGELFNDPQEKQPLDPESLTQPQQQVRAMLQYHVDQFANVFPPAARKQKTPGRKKQNGNY